MTVSFHKEEDQGLTHSIEMPKVPDPDELKDEIQMREEGIDKIPEDLRPFFLKKESIQLSGLSGMIFLTQNQCLLLEIFG